MIGVIVTGASLVVVLLTLAVAAYDAFRTPAGRWLPVLAWFFYPSWIGFAVGTLMRWGGI